MGAKQGHPNWMIWSNTDDEKQEELKISWMFSLWPGPLRPGPSFTTRLITIYHQRPPSRPQSWWTISTYWNNILPLLIRKKTNCQLRKSNHPLFSRRQSWWTISTYWNMLTNSLAFDQKNKLEDLIFPLSSHPQSWWTISTYWNKTYYLTLDKKNNLST